MTVKCFLIDVIDGCGAYLIPNGGLHSNRQVRQLKPLGLEWRGTEQEIGIVFQHHAARRDVQFAVWARSLDVNVINDGSVIGFRHDVLQLPICQVLIDGPLHCQRKPAKVHHWRANDIARADSHQSRKCEPQNRFRFHKDVSSPFSTLNQTCACQHFQ